MQSCKLQVAGSTCLEPSGVWLGAEATHRMHARAAPTPHGHHRLLISSDECYRPRNSMK